jgi:ADP-dependent phosphofructokinase/glucokinase
MIVGDQFEERAIHGQGVFTLAHKHPLSLDKHLEFLRFSSGSASARADEESFSRNNLMQLNVKVVLGEQI